MKLFWLIIICVFLNNTGSFAAPGDTTVIRTFRFDTNMRQGYFNFPSDTNKTYEKILMLYSMRCKNGLVSNSQNPNQGCGEWDYNCFTYVIDSSQTDSLRLKHNSHDISNFTGDTFEYTTLPVYSYTQYVQQSVTYDSVISETSVTVGNGFEVTEHPLHTAVKTSKTLYLFRAGELLDMGLTAGDITGIRLDIASPGTPAGNLRIGLKSGTATELDPEHPETEGFTEVYFLNTAFINTGNHEFRFYQPFYWDGVSSLLMEFSITGDPGSNTGVNGHDAGFTAGLSSQNPDSYITFTGGIQLMKLNSSFFPGITDKITVAFWAYGDSLKLPANTTFMEGVDQANRRQVNIHLPWSNSRIYWDCGNDGSGYDRLDKAATPDEIEGKWNFWAFTKNASTGIMNIYKNGNLWATAGGKTRLIDIRKWVVGKDVSGGLNYWGHMDELSIWKKDLDSASIAKIMHRDIDPSHPDYGDLLAYYQFNQSAGDTVTDSGPNQYASIIINPGWRGFAGHELYKNFDPLTQRPNTEFVRGDYQLSIDSLPVIDSVLQIATSVISYIVHNNDLITVDTIYVWPAGFTYVTDPLGNILDSLAVHVQNSITVSPLTYYQRRPMRVELINFITPYGLGLNLNGLNGKTWVFDVTDYATVLRGKKFMAMSDGIYQEDNDITFIYYEGTPPREVLSLQQVWPSGAWVSPSYNDIYKDNYFEARSMNPLPWASQFKLRTAISGHGQEGEFIPRMHTLSLNDSITFTYQVWKHCSDNPIYPQGGTWVYDRAGWCPGAVVDTREFEITGLVQPGQAFTLDYSLPYNMNPGSSNYRVNNQLVSYGPASFSTDAALEYIKQPSDRVEFARFNPLCNQPVVGIKNTGSDTLTSLQIVYGRSGGSFSTFQWTGNLGFLRTEAVTLPMPDWNSSSSDRFIAYVKQPNGLNDPYALNDTAWSKILAAPAYPSTLMFEMKSNNRPWENIYLLLNSNGDTLLYRSNLTANTLYRDTLTLADDCYVFRMMDTGDDGLSFWNNPGQGSGYMRIKSSVANIIYKTFGADFGDNIYHQFMVDHSVDIEEITDSPVNNIILYPNPTDEQVRISFDNIPGTVAEISIIGMTGQVLQQTVFITGAQNEESILDVSGLEEGVYLVVVRSGATSVTKRLVIIR
ncbi:MAG: peptide-N-glycosidase F-related protein [Bacteroidales bacterium]